jgi:uncharacterized protein YjbI with pentapeptide repeats
MSEAFGGGPEGAPRRLPVPGEIEAIREAHARWLKSRGREGQRAVLGGLDLTGLDLRNADLRRADLRGAFGAGPDLTCARLADADLRGAELCDAKLRGADLHGADLSEADLSGANLQGANLARADLRGARLRRTRLRDAILADADLSCAVGLLAGQLGGASLAGATLPAEILKFEGLGNVTEASKSTQGLFTSILLVCAYTWLTIASTSDAQLLNNDAPASSRLPILGIDIPLVRFYTAVPLLLLCIYLYFHLMLQRLWEELSELPAVFPDGRALDKKAYPWLLNILVRDHAPRLRESRSYLAKWQARMSALLAWGLVPITVAMCWVRYLHAHDWWVTAIHIGCVSMAVGTGIAFLRLAEATLRGAERKLAMCRRAWRSARAVCLAVTAGIAVLLGFVSMGVIEGFNPHSVYDDKLAARMLAEFHPLDVRRWMPDLLYHLHLSSSATLTEAALSAKPANWSPNKPELLDTVHGADLEHRRRSQNLRHAMAFNMFGVGAYLQDSDLRWSDFREADLRRADFRKSLMRGVNFRFAEVNGADFRNADLTESRFRQADVDGAKFEGARLEGANFADAKVRGVSFELATLVGADFSKADLSPLPPPDTDAGKSNAKPTPTVFSGADLTGATLTAADLSGVQFQPTGPDDEVTPDRPTRLVRAKLVDATLVGANLTRADLTGAVLRRAKLDSDVIAIAPAPADLALQSIPRTDLTGADLTGADLSGASLRHAILTGACLDRAILTGADLSDAEGLTREQLANAVTDASTRLPANVPVLARQVEGGGR